jgi:hypothetical protein
LAVSGLNHWQCNILVCACVSGEDVRNCLHMHSEEERLAVSKLLIDLEIESNDGKDQLAQEKYKFETRLLHLESEVCLLPCHIYLFELVNLCVDQHHSDDATEATYFRFLLKTLPFCASICCIL